MKQNYIPGLYYPWPNHPQNPVIRELSVVREGGYLENNLLAQGYDNVLRINSILILQKSSLWKPMKTNTDLTIELSHISFD